MLEQQPHDRFGQHDQAERGRERQPGRKLKRARLRMRHRITVPATHRARQLRHQHGAHGDADDAMIAPATISHCGPELAIMPGIALAKKPRISLSKLMRRGVARRALCCDSSIRSCNKPAMPTVAASIHAATVASACQSRSAAIAAISVTLNSSGENAVSAKRPCALSR